MLWSYFSSRYTINSRSGGIIRESVEQLTEIKTVIWNPHMYEIYSPRHSPFCVCLEGLCLVWGKETLCKWKMCGEKHNVLRSLQWCYMSVPVSQTTGHSTICSNASICKGNIKTITYCPFWGKSTGHRGNPLTKDQWCGKQFHFITHQRHCNIQWSSISETQISKFINSNGIYIYLYVICCANGHFLFHCDEFLSRRGQMVISPRPDKWYFLMAVVVGFI